MQAPIKKWSFSALKQYEQCPYASYLAKVERAETPNYDDDPKHPLTRGNRVHKEAELFIRGEGPLTREIKKFEPRLKELAERFQDGKVEVEQRWGFTREWELVDWSHPDCWLMIICDVVDHCDDGTICVDDWKTGKSFGNEVKHTQQGQLYGVVTLLKYPSVDLVNVGLSYLDEGKRKAKRYNRAALPQLLQRWESRGKKMTGAMAFPAKANRMNCRFCAFGIENGTGACAYAVGLNT